MKSLPTSLTAGLFALRRRALVIAGLFGVLFLVGGCIVQPDTPPGIILLGLATSLIAAVALALATIEQEEFAQRILDLGVQSIFDDRNKGLEEGVWTELLGRTKREFRVLGMANHGYLSSPEAKGETEDALKKALGRKKAEVEFLWLDPEHDLAKLREKEERRRGLRRDTCASIIFFWEVREQLSDEQKERFSMRSYEAVPTCGLSWADDYMVVTHYLAGQLNLRAPGVVLRGSIPSYERLFARFRKDEASTPNLVKRYTSNYQAIKEEWSRDIEAPQVESLRRLLKSLEEEPEGKRSEAELRQEDGE